VQVLAVVHGAEVVLDAAAAQRVKKESPPPKAFQAEAPPAAAPTTASPPLLDRAQTRTALFFKLLSLINGRSGVRLAVAEALAALLNSSVTPALHAADADAASLAALAAFLQGVGAAGVEADEQLDAPTALAKAGLEGVPGLSTQERAVLTDGQSCAAGTAALCCAAGRQLLAAANAVAALSAEALQADVSPRLLPLVCFHLAQHRCYAAACCT
jgi:histidine ammonia-lyase